MLASAILDRLGTYAQAFAYKWKLELNERSLLFRLAQKLRQLGKNSGDPLRLVAREQLVAPKPATRLLLESRACPLASLTTKQLSSSPTDQGGGKLRSGMARS